MRELSTVDTSFTEMVCVRIGSLVEPLGDYVGDFKDGEKHGQGVYWGYNGVRYEGGYAKEYRHGKGTIFNDDGRITYRGGMKKDTPHGMADS